MRQMQNWTYEFNTRSTVSPLTGYIQITDSTYVNEEILDNTLEIDQIPLNKIKDIKGVSSVHKRFQTGALLSTGIKSKFAGVLGIQPSKDSDILKLKNKLRKGSLLTDEDTGILITEKMAQYYKVSVGDSLILIGQGYQGMNAAAILPVKGIVYFSAGDMANMVFMSLKQAQNIFVAPDRFTHCLINIEQGKNLNSIKNKVSSIITDPTLKIRTWEEVLPGLKQGLEIDSNSGLLISGILYMIVGFGIFGTIVMLYNERKFEFGVLTAIGMPFKTLLITTLTELGILTSIGIVLGNLFVFPFVYHLYKNPIQLQGETAKAMIDQGFEPYVGTGIFADVFIMNSLVLFIIAACVSSYIVLKLINLNALKAMRQ